MKQQLQKALVILMFLITGTVIVALALYMEFGDGIKGFWGIGGQGKGNEAETQVGGELTEASKTAEDNSNKMSMGIDVSKWQGIIDFEKAKESDIEFVMVRIGYRTAKDGVIEADGNAAYNLQKAQAAGLWEHIFTPAQSARRRRGRKRILWRTLWQSIPSPIPLPMTARGIRMLTAGILCSRQRKEHRSP